MKPFERLQGNEKQKKYFGAEIDKGRLPHAFILEGEEGSGKKTLALAVAAALARDETAGEKIFSLQCPDVCIYGPPPEKKIFTVDIVRRMKADAAIKPNDLSFKLFILEKGETMNQQAQNAALKILEEPPENTYFFILTESAAALLPTVRSRAPVIRMQRFSGAEIEQLLQKNKEYAAMKVSDPAFFDGCIKACGGSYGKALSLLSGKEQGATKERAEKIVCTFSQKDRAELLILAGKLPQNRQEFDKILFYLQTALRDMLYLRASGNPRELFFFESAEAARAAAGSLTGGQIIALFDLCALTREQVSRNVNLQNARMALAGGIIKIIF
ncbi:MAG: hypothetical protein IJY89_07240 [Clostridia bacterium]|nr:hypothetical protein [Clostridia bacterium]